MCKRLHGFAETADRTAVSEFTLRRLADKGYLRTVTIGARRLIPAEEVERLVREGAGKPRKRKGPRREDQSRTVSERNQTVASGHRDGESLSGNWEDRGE